MRVLDDSGAVAAAAAGAIAEAVRGGARTLVLAGGTTPEATYRVLAGIDLPWGRVTVLFGDERCVPPTDPESNYRMARETLLDRVSPATVHRIPAELGPDEGAAAYQVVLERLPRLDFVLLGIGEDGHCASLFPGSPALGAAGFAVGVTGAPKPPPERVSLTLTALRGARQVLFVATGAGKADAVRRAVRGEVPAGMILGAEWIVDRAAAA
jgi:6-phosphogluconolactonase